MNVIERRIDHGNHPPGQIQNADRLVAADVAHAADGGRASHQGQDHADHVAHVGEAPLLLPVVVNQQGPARQGGIDQRGSTMP